MAAKFQSAIHRRDDITYLKVAGVIDEDNELGSVADSAAARTVVIDLGEVERINSCGVRDWVNWLGRLEKAGSRVILVECSPSIVAQVNLVNNFTGGGVVKSFYAPYFCPSCDREKVLLIETRDALGTSPFKAPTCRCDECDGPMDFDDMEESYFAFLQHAAKIVTDARVDEVVTEFTPSETGPRLRTRTSGTPSQLPSVPSSNPGPVSSLPSVPSLPSIKKLAENYQAASSGRHVLQAAVAANSGRFERTGPTQLAAGGTLDKAVSGPHARISGNVPAVAPAATVAPPSNKVFLMLAGALVVAAIVVAVLVFK